MDIEDEKAEIDIMLDKAEEADSGDTEELDTHSGNENPTVDEDFNESDDTDNEDQDDSEDSEDNDSEDTDESEGSEDVDEEFTVTIGKESPPKEDEEMKKAPTWVKELRKQNRELKKENRELNEKIESVSGVTPKAIELGVKPTLESSDHDDVEYDKQLNQWYQRKIEVDKQKQVEVDKQQQETNAWNTRLADYNKGKEKLSVKVIDYADAESVAQDSLSKTQQGMIVGGADDPALVIYALGKNPGKLKELSKIEKQ